MTASTISPTSLCCSKVCAAMVFGVWHFAMASGALGSDWTVKSQVSQGIEVNDNRAVVPQSSGSTIESISRLTVDATKVLPTFRFGVGGDLSLRALEGPGADASTAPNDNGLWFKAEAFDRLTKYNVFGSWRRQDAVSAQIEDSDLNTIRGDINSYQLEGTIQRQFSALDSLSWSTRVKHVDIDSPAGAPFWDVALTTTWTRRQTATTDLFQSLQFEWLDADDPSDSQTKFARAFTGLQSHLTKRLTFRGSVGASWVTTDRDSVGIVSGPVSGITLMSASNYGTLADAALTWRPLQGTTVLLSASHNLEPNTVGEIQRRSRVGVELSHAINHSSKLSLMANVSRNDYLDRVLDSGSTDLLRASITYNYQWTPEWQTRLAYKFTHREDSLGTANSNALFVSVVRDINWAGR